VSVSVGVSRRWCTGVVFMQPGLKVNGVYYSDILLLKQLLPNIYQTAGELLSSAPRVRRSMRNKTPDFTPDVASQQTGSHHLSSIDYRLLRVIQECVYQKQQGTSNIVDEL